MDLKEFGWIVGSNISQVAGSWMLVLVYYIIAFGFQREELKSDIYLSFIFLFYSFQLMVEEKTVRAKKISIFNNADRGLIKFLGGFSCPVR
jgi:hypothetical protein